MTKGKDYRYSCYKSFPKTNNRILLQIKRKNKLVKMVDYSTKRISKPLLNEVSKALRSIDSYGSVELYVQNNQVTQITTRNIKKTNGFSNSNNTGKNTEAVKNIL